MVSEKKMRKTLMIAIDDSVEHLNFLNRSDDVQEVQETIELINALVKVHNYYSIADKMISTLDIMEENFDRF